MDRIIEPEAVFSPKEIKRLERWISYYEYPLKPALIVACITFFGVIALFIVLAKVGTATPPSPGGERSAVWLLVPGFVIGIATFFFVKSIAANLFLNYDKKYFHRTALSEEIYLKHLMLEARKEAALRFTEWPNGRNLTMFQYPKEQQAEVYKAFEADFLRECAKKEQALLFKAYVARRYGLRVPLKKS